MTAAARTTLAGNLDTYYMSSEGALLAGAITADARGGGAIWYNPAGLSQISGLRLDVSVNAFRLSTGAMADVETPDPTSRINLQSVNLRSIPASITLSRHLGDVGVGFGVFIPTNDAAVLRTQVKGRSTSDDGDVELGVDASWALVEYFVGPGVGWRISPELSLGASLFVTYRSELDVIAVGGSVAPDSSDELGAVQLHDTVDWQQIGMQGVCGLKLRPDRNWAGGLTLRLPVIRFYEVRQHVQLQLASAPGRTMPLDEFRDTSGFDGHVIAPPRVHAGLSRRLEDWQVALDANYQFPLSDDDQRQELHAVANLRAGARYQVSPTLRVGGGLFTDRSPYDAKAFMDRSLNYYGVTIGGEFSTPYTTVQKGEKVYPAPRQLVFATGLALSYAVGVGRIVHAEVISADPTTLELRAVPRDMVAHELTLHIAATLGE